MGKFAYKIGILSVLLCIPCFSYAVEYKIQSPDTQNFATPTSDNSIYIGTNNDVNINRSKNSAYIPPAFGTPTAYIKNRSEFLTPNLATQTYSSTSTLASSIHSSLPQISNNLIQKSEIEYTKLTKDLYYSNDKIGTLKIPELDLTANIYEGTDDKTLAKGVGHFSISSIWNGNVVIGGHNRGVNKYFGKIHTLDIGDKITLKTKLGTRTYKVYSVQKILNTDFTTPLEITKENTITLVTCVKNEANYRWCIKAREV